MRRIWRDHSLSITLTGLGALFLAIAIPFREGTTFDIVSMIGGSFLTGGFIYIARGPLNEVNKEEPDGDPDG